MTALSRRRFERRDIPALMTWFPSERDALQWAGAALAWPLNRADLVTLIKQHAGPEPEREVWAVCRGEQMIGHYQVRQNRRLRTIGLGRVAIDPSQRGRGLGHALTHLAVTHAFTQDWVQRLELLVYSHNVPAIETYETAGFVREGTRRQTTPIGSEVWDTLMMSMLRPEYEKKFDKRTERE